MTLVPETLAFLRDLAAHNDRDWFAANRARHRAAVQAPAEAFAAAVSAGLLARTGAGVPARHYRLHRDLRFARDKTPFHTHLHIGFSDRPGGAAWMVGLETGRFVVGYGVMAFAPPQLARWREAVAGPDGAALMATLEAMRGGGARLDVPELARVPAPHRADHPAADLLRRKGLTLWHDLPPEAAFGAAGIDRTLAMLAGFEPVRDWLLSRLGD